MDKLKSNAAWLSVVVSCVALGSVLWAGGQKDQQIADHERRIEKIEDALEKINRIPVIETKIDALKEGFDKHERKP